MSLKTTNSFVSYLQYERIKSIIISSSDFLYTTIGLMFKIGSVNDCKDKAGLNYIVYRLLIEQMYRNDLITEIYSKGGLLKTSAEKEFVCYSIQTFSSDIVSSISKLLSILDALHFTEEDLSRVKRTIASESYKSHDNISDYLYRVTYEKTFVRQSISRMIYGKENTIFNITSEDVYNFFYKNYQAKNVVLVIATPEKNLNIGAIRKSVDESVLANRDIGCANIIKKYKFIARKIINYKNVKNFYSMYTYPIKGINYLDEAIKSLVIEEIFNETLKKMLSTNPDLIELNTQVMHYCNLGLIHFRCVSSTPTEYNYMKNLIMNVRIPYIEMYRVIQRMIVKLKEFYDDSLNTVYEYARHYLYVKKIKNPTYEINLLNEMSSEGIKDYMFSIFNKQPTLASINPKKISNIRGRLDLNEKDEYYR